MTDRTWTISNILSISRALLVIPIVVLLLDDGEDHRFLVVGIMALAMLTDTLDGVLARALHQETQLGRILDPLADKIGVVAIAGVLTYREMVPLWFFVAALVRDLLILAGGLYIKLQKNIVLQSNPLGKWTVTVIAVYIIVTTLRLSELQMIKQPLLIASTILIIASFIGYVRKFIAVQTLR
jgi:CDP-diacylglycerol--glycerol-3-phosphate 3-phosphatidyltransferase